VARVITGPGHMKRVVARWRRTCGSTKRSTADQAAAGAMRTRRQRAAMLTRAGDKAPLFVAPGTSGDIDLGARLEEKTVVLYFFPAR